MVPVLAPTSPPTARSAGCAARCPGGGVTTRHRHIGVADGDDAFVVAHQSAGIAPAPDFAALGVAGGDPGGGFGVADERAQSGAGGGHDGRVNQADLLDVAGAGAEQPQGILGSADDGQVGDGVAVAVEPAGVGRRGNGNSRKWCHS